jgi:hypothetical protein
LADQGRVVVVAAGFGLWQGGKCLAAGKWTDIATLRAYKRPESPEVIRVAIELRDGSAVEILEPVPGFGAFASAAVAKLPGTPPPDEWLPALRAAPPNEERTLFTRSRTY